MAFQADSTTQAAGSATQAAGAQPAPAAGWQGDAHGRPLTPYQAVKMLPKTATPSQQDSIIQHYFAPEKVEYNQQPDTLGLPGQPGVHVARKRWDFRDEAYFKDSLHTTVPDDSWGIAGDPTPYTLSGDNVFTSLLIGCFLLALIAVSRSLGFITKQAKDFFYVRHSDNVTITETTGEVRFQLFLATLTALLCSTLYYFYTLEYVAQTFVLPSQYHLLGVFFAIFIVYFIARWLLYQLVNATFFNKKKNGQWNKSSLFLTAAEGVLLFPIVLLRIYFDLPMKSVAVYTLATVILIKLLSIFKSYIIFFRRFGVFLQIILYFCALEIVPMLMLWGFLDATSNYLKINF